MNKELATILYSAITFKPETSITGNGFKPETSFETKVCS